ncbi:hypothetical protein LOD99_1024 [Oopsacas minuta]|uniref:Cyclic nucleotide-binding domain-containing protein n=1 Tax=Oopsacas minuta TaxID=111878 RepID=A0AAV7K069_9METZ|nr:hypothetical protein LOD99_1024 [Oopsacas minuta]
MQNSPQIKTKTSFINTLLSPTGIFVHLWDNLILTSIILNALLVGFQASFNSSIVWLVVISYMLDVLFIMDVFLQFIMGYNEKGIQVTNLSKTAKHYVTTIFIIDMFSIFPFELLGAIPMIGPSYYVVALARLNRVVRIYRIFWLVLKNQSSLGTSLNFMQTVKYLSYIFILLQIASCMWYSISCKNTYLTSHTVCVRDSWYYNSTLSLIKNNTNDTSDFENFIGSIYWGMATITSAGFGDIVAIRSEEKLVAILFMLAGTLLFGFIVGSITSNITNSDTTWFLYVQRIRAIMHFMQDTNVSHSLREKVWRYYNFLFESKHGVEDKMVRKGLPKHMQGDISMKIAQEFLDELSLFKGAQYSFYRALAVEVEPSFYLSGQSIVKKGKNCDFIYYIRKGKAVIMSPDDDTTQVKILEEGEIIGELSLVYSYDRIANIVALTNCETLRFSREKLNRVLVFFPEVRGNMKKIAKSRVNEAVKESSTEDLFSMSRNSDISTNETNFIHGHNSGCIRDTTSKTSVWGHKTESRENTQKKTNNVLAQKVQKVEKYFMYGMMVLLPLWSIIVPYIAIFSSIEWHMSQTISPGFWVLYALLYFIDIFFVLDTLLVGNNTLDFKSPYYIMSLIIEVCSNLPIEIMGAIIGGSIIGYKVLWLLRLNRLIKWIKLSSYFGKMEKKLGSRIEILRCLKYFLYIFCSTHVVACMWFAIATFEGRVIEGSWASFHQLDLSHSVLHNYVTSFYFSAVTLTSTGFGDIHAHTTIEQVSVICLSLIGFMLYGYCLATLASTLGNNALPKVLFQEKISGVNNFLSNHKISVSLRKRIEKYFELFWMKWQGQRGQEHVMFDLPLPLQENMASEIQEDIIRAMPLFAHTDPNYLKRLCLNTITYTYCPGEFIIYAGDMGKEMYFLRRGTVEVLDETMSYAISTIAAGGYFGEEGLLFGTPRTVSIRASTYCEVIMLHKNAIDDTAQSYPLIKKHFEELSENRKLSQRAIQESAVPLPSIQELMYPNLYNTAYSMLKILHPLFCFALPYDLSNIIMNSVNDDNIINKITHPMVTPFGLTGIIQPFTLRKRQENGVRRKESVSSIQRSLKKYTRASKIVAVELMEKPQGWTNTRLFKGSQDVSNNIETQQTMYRKSLDRIKNITAMFMLRLALIPMSRFYAIWEFLITDLAFASYFLICLQAGFCPNFIALVVVNYMLDVGFFVDMVLKLHTAYFDKQQHMVTHPAHCAANYLKGNLVFDILANFPTEFFLPIISIFGATSYMKILALLRMNRLIRIYKIPLAFGHFTKKITRTGYIFLQLEFIIILFLLMHLTGTIWFLLAQSQEYYLTDMVTRFTQQSWAAEQRLFHNSSVTRQYIISLYWAATATSTVGYGDIYASTVAERLYTSFVIIIGILYYGFVMANVAANIANADAQMASFKEKMVNVVFFLKDQNIDTALQKRIMNFFKFIWGETKGINASELFKEMPLGLQGDIALSLYKSLIDKVPLFNNTEIGFSKLLSLSIRPEYFPKGEYVVKKGDLGSSMYFIYRGVVDVVSEDGSTVFASMGEGKFFGEISVLSQLPRTASIRASTNCALFVLRKVDLDLALEAYPHINEQIKEEANRRMNLVKQRSKAAKEAKEKGADPKAAAEAAARAAKDKESVQASDKTKAATAPEEEEVHFHKASTCVRRKKRNWSWFKSRVQRSTNKIWDNIMNKYEKLNPIKYTIHPDSKKAMVIKLVEFFLIYISTFSIMFHGFFQDTAIYLLVVNYIFEICFIPLMLVKFHMAYFDEDGMLRSSLRDIAEHYLLSPLSFGLDIVSLLPMEIFCLVLADPKLRLSYLLYLRITHALRGIKLPFILSEQEKTLSFWTTYIRIFKFFVLTTLTLHIVCCVWFMMGCQLGVCNPNSWAVSKSVSITTFVNGTYRLDKDFSSVLDQYLTSMYWTVATMTSTGYGDIVPTQELEMVLAIVLIPIGRFVMGFILGNITSTLASLNAQKVQYESKFKVMKSYMDDLCLPASIQGRVKEFYEYHWSKNKGTNRNELLEEFPYCLRNELLGIVNDQALNSIPILKRFDANIQRHIALLLEPLLLTQGEYVAKIGDVGQEVYFIKKGSVECLDSDRRYVKSLGPGDYFGFLETLGRKPYKYSHRTVTHCELITLTEENFELLKEAYDTESNKAISSVMEPAIADLDKEEV